MQSQPTPQRVHQSHCGSDSAKESDWEKKKERESSRDTDRKSSRERESVWEREIELENYEVRQENREGLEIMK